MGGIAGVVLARGGDTFAAQWKARAKVEAASRGADSSSSALAAGLSGAETLRAPVLHFGMLGAALVLVAFGFAPASRKRTPVTPCS